MSEAITDLLRSVLERAIGRGATAADAFLAEGRHFSATVRLGEVDTVAHARDQRLSLRVFSGRASAAASTSDLSPASLERVIDEASRLAKVTAEDPCAGLPGPDDLIGRPRDLDLHDDGGHDLTPEEKIEIARRTEAAALARDPQVANSEGAEYWDRQARYAYATSAGFAADYATSGFGLSVAPVAVRGDEKQRDAWYSMARKRSRLDPPRRWGVWPPSGRCAVSARARPGPPRFQ